MSEPQESSGNLEAIEAGRDWLQLTEGFMIDPEASVSTLVIHHPDCTYFSGGDAGEN